MISFSNEGKKQYKFASEKEEKIDSSIYNYKKIHTLTNDISNLYQHNKFVVLEGKNNDTHARVCGSIECPLSSPIVDCLQNQSKGEIKYETENQILSIINSQYNDTPLIQDSLEKTQFQDPSIIGSNRLKCIMCGTVFSPCDLTSCKCSVCGLKSIDLLHGTENQEFKNNQNHFINIDIKRNELLKNEKEDNNPKLINSIQSRQKLFEISYNRFYSMDKFPAPVIQEQLFAANNYIDPFGNYFDKNPFIRFSHAIPISNFSENNFYKSIEEKQVKNCLDLLPDQMIEPKNCELCHIQFTSSGSTSKVCSICNSHYGNSCNIQKAKLSKEGLKYDSMIDKRMVEEREDKNKENNDELRNIVHSRNKIFHIEKQTYKSKEISLKCQNSGTLWISTDYSFQEKDNNHKNLSCQKTRNKINEEINRRLTISNTYTYTKYGSTLEEVIEDQNNLEKGKKTKLAKETLKKYKESLYDILRSGRSIEEIKSYRKQPFSTSIEKLSSPGNRTFNSFSTKFGQNQLNQNSNSMKLKIVKQKYKDLLTNFNNQD